MDWFERITGFPERSYGETQAQLAAVDGTLRSAGQERSWWIGELETPTLAELRQRTDGIVHRAGAELKVSSLQGDPRRLHCQPLNSQALFQVASRFNLLHLPTPEATPEAGVTSYQEDRSQGSACAVSAGTATIYRNYLVPLPGGIGQTSSRQLDCLSDMRDALSVPGRPLWQMRNGHVVCSRQQLASVDAALAALPAPELERVRGLLRIGLHWDVEVTESATPGQRVSQALCSALPVAHSGFPAQEWERFAMLMLQAAYEATLLAGVLNRERTGCPTVFLTDLGGGTSGHPPEWAEAAMAHAFDVLRGCDLDVRIVDSRGAAPKKER